MANKEEVNGVSTKRKRPVVIPVEDNPANQFLSKEEFVANRQKEKLAKKKAEEAYEEVMKGSKSEPKAEKKVSKTDDKVAELRKELADINAELVKKPESKSLLKKLQKVSVELEAAEAEQE